MLQNLSESPVYQISIYHVFTRNPIRLLGANSTTPYTSLEFSSDDKLLIALSGSGRSYILHCWLWLKEKSLSTSSIQDAVDRVRVNPSDPMQITVSGPSFFKQFKLQHDYTLKATALLSGTVDVSTVKLLKIAQILTIAYNVFEHYSKQ